MSHTTVAEMMTQLFDEAELIDAIDEAVAMGNVDPLLSLDTLVRIMTEIDTELIKAEAPALLEHAPLRAGRFAQKGQAQDISKNMSRAVASFHRTQESLRKLGAARIRTRRLSANETNESKSEMRRQSR